MKKILKNPKRSSFLKLIKESDRGCVSVVAEFFNERIAVILVLAMSVKDIQMKKLSHNFGERIKEAFRSKIITEEQFKALDAIRELRNEADHTNCDFSFADKDVVDHLKQLERYAKMIDSDRLMDFEDILEYVEVGENGNMPRFLFLVTCFQIFKELENNIYELAYRLKPPLSS